MKTYAFGPFRNDGRPDGQVPPKDGLEMRHDGQLAILAAFAADDAENPRVQVDMAELQIRQLRAAQPGQERGGDERVIPQPQGARISGESGQKLLLFRDGNATRSRTTHRVLLHDSPFPFVISLRPSNESHSDRPSSVNFARLIGRSFHPFPGGLPDCSPAPGTPPRASSLEALDLAQRLGRDAGLRRTSEGDRCSRKSRAGRMIIRCFAAHVLSRTVAGA